MSLLSLIPGRIKALAVAALGVLLAIFGAHYAGRREGRSQANSEALQKDVKRANEIRDKADSARGNDGDSLDRLQRSGRV